MFISNNHTSFHLWWKENLVKHQKVLKHYGNDWCFKTPDKPTCIELILTNWSNLFQHSNAFETSHSDFPLSTVTEIKMGFQNLKPNKFAYCDYKNFDNIKFRYDIVTATSNVDNFGMYLITIFNIFNHHDPIKKSTFILIKLPSC